VELAQVSWGCRCRYWCGSRCRCGYFL